MVAAYELLPTTDSEQAAAAHTAGAHSTFVRHLKALFSSFDKPRRAFRDHAEALDTAWLLDLERLGGPVFTCFMVMRIGLLSLAVFWGFLLVGPLWCFSLISSDRLLPSALQTGLVITLIIILEPLPFVALMKDPRSKAFHVLYSMYLLVGWREVCVYLVSDEALGWFASRDWVRDIVFTLASAAVLGCGALGWTIWEGWQRRLWTLFSIFSLLLLQIIHRGLRTDT